MRIAGPSQKAVLDALLRSKISQIQDVLPDFGEGFLAACLEALGGDAERVMNHLLEGSLPAGLAEMDPHMPFLATPAAPQGEVSERDVKGKGKAAAQGESSL